jgi:UPF0271 protein
MQTVDLNCDMGEGCSLDAELLKLISSANIACGYHAGDAPTMRRTAELALANNVAIGAHRGYRDRSNFGRTPMSLSPAEVFDLIADQIDSLQAICAGLGTRLHHVKPHGALYNQAAKDRDLAAALARAVAARGRDLVFYGLSGSYLISEAEAAGLRTASEVFADRTYRSDGTLTPRSEPNALIPDVASAVSQVRQMIATQSVIATTGETVPIRAETICIHGDGEHALEFARAVSDALREDGVRILDPTTDRPAA